MISLTEYHRARPARAVEYYNKILFHDATFGDMMQTGRPMIIINASDLAYGVRFSFIQDYFNLLCSDIRDFPIASAVAASSAVPVVFNPVVVKNYPGCPEPKVPPEVAEMAKHSNAATLDNVREKLKAWASQISTPEHEVKPYFIEVSFEEVPQPQLRLFLNKIPTSFSLEPDQVEALIKTSRELVREDPDFQQLLKDIAQ